MRRLKCARLGAFVEKTYPKKGVFTGKIFAFGLKFHVLMVVGPGIHGFCSRLFYPVTKASAGTMSSADTYGRRKLLPMV